GRRTLNRVAPGSLDTSTVPWCASTTALTMASPRPVLPARREREESPRANRSNREPRSSGGTPGPSSSTVSTTSSPLRSSAATTLVPSGVCTRAFASRFVTTWRRRGSSPVPTVGSSESRPSPPWPGPAARASPPPLRAGPGRLRIADGFHHDTAEVDGLSRELAPLVQTGEQKEILDQFGH